MSSFRGWSPRTVMCATFMASMLVACKGQRGGRTDTATQAKSAKASVEEQGPFITERSSLTVQSGDMTNDSLAQAIIDSARATLSGQSPWDDKHDRMDERRLMKGQCGPGSTTCVPGPYVQIIPRKRIHQNATLGTGRVVAKLVNLESNFAYEKLALYRGTPEAYWWVGVRPGGTDTISVYVPSDWTSDTKKAKWRSVTVMLTDPGNPNFRHAQPSARFVWNDQDDETWASCVSNGCCQPPVLIEPNQASNKAAPAADNP